MNHEMSAFLEAAHTPLTWCSRVAAQSGPGVNLIMSARHSIVPSTSSCPTVPAVDNVCIVSSIRTLDICFFFIFRVAIRNYC